MSAEARELTLTKSQADCLAALRLGKATKTDIAIQARLNLRKATAALETLERLRLAKQDRVTGWHMTARGKTCCFDTIPDQQRRDTGRPGAGGQRLLDLLDRPMRGSELVEKLGVTHQNIRQLVIALHAKGLVSFGDLASPFWLVKRADDPTPLLSRDEARVLSVIPQEYTTSVTKIRLAARLPEHTVQPILDRLVEGGLVEALDGLQGRVYRATAAGLSHPQLDEPTHRAEAPRLPVESDRVRQVLSAIQASGALRIRDLTNRLSIQQQSMNALMQYLKRKGLVEKTGRELSAPYTLTEKGCAALAEMTRRKAA